MDPIAPKHAPSSSVPAGNFRNISNEFRIRAAVNIQKLWRRHRAELLMASAMVHSWNLEVRFQDGNQITATRRMPYVYRQQALEQAVRAVKCWWILEGLHFQDNWITVAWENEVRIGEENHLPLLVHLTCEARSLRIASSLWDPTKLATLLVRATLKKAILGEHAARKIALWYKNSRGRLHLYAVVLQRWNRRLQAARSLQQEQEVVENGDNHQDESDKEEDTDGYYSIDQVYPEKYEMAYSNDVSSVGQYEDTLQSLKSDASLGDGYSRANHIAAIQIQSFLRLAALKLAVKEWPSMMGQLRAALKTAGSTLHHLNEKGGSLDEFEAARKILSTTMIAQYLCGTGCTVAEVESLMNTKLGTDFISQRAAALAIHNIVRAYLTGLKKYRDKKRATTIQAVFRGYSVRKRLELEDLSAVVIQFGWSNRRYTRIRDRNATKIQALLRMTFCKRNYEMHRFCIVFIQASWRRAIVRRRLAWLGSSAILMQSTWRRFRNRETYLRVRSAVATIQRLFRIRQTKASYQQECLAVVRIQSWWRTMAAKLILVRSLGAASCLQSHTRSLIQRRFFHKMRFAAITVQCTWRKHIHIVRYERQNRANLCLQTFCRKHLSINAAYRRRGNIICIQKAYRRHLCQNQFKVAVRSSTKLQQYWRRHREQASYRFTMRAIETIQAFSRGLNERRKFLIASKAILDIQRLARGRRGRHRASFLEEEARKEMIERRCNGATAIQKTWRGSVDRYRYNTLVRLTVMLQKVSRRILARSLYMKRRDAGLVIQSWLRRIAADCGAKRSWLASTEIQRIWRGFVASKYAAAIRLKKAMASSIKIQSKWRGVMQRDQYNEVRAATISTQAFVRRYLVSKRMKALCRERSIVQSSILIQSQWRSAIARKRYAVARGSAITIQSCVRRVLHTEYVKMLMFRRREIERGIISIQSHWRGVKHHNNYNKARASAITIQSSIRRVLASRLVQSNWRAAMARDNFSRARGSETVVQASRRLLASHTKDALLHAELAEKSSILIQSQWRGVMARFSYYEAFFSAITIQAAIRRMLAWKKTELIRKIIRSAILIQSRWRGALAHNRHTASPTTISVVDRLSEPTAPKLSKMKSQVASASYDHQDRWSQRAIIIQSYWRASKAREEYMESRVAAMMIQAMARGVQIRSRFKSFQGSTIFVQLLIRGHLRRKRLYEIHIAAVNIQRVWKGNIATRRVKQLKFQRVTESSTRIQSQWRASKARGEFAAMVIQAMTRGVQVRSQWRFVRLLSKKKDVFHVSARKIQTAYILWRMNIALWEMRSLAVLLKRGVRGQLARSVIQYSLMHMNSLRHSMIVDSYDRLVINQDTDRGVSSILAWHRAVSDINVSAAIVVQSFVRRFIAKKQVNDKFGVSFDTSLAYAVPTVANHQAAITIQRAFLRGKNLRKYSAVLIQKRVRTWIARTKHLKRVREADDETRREAAATIQKLYRCHEERSKAIIRRQSIIQIQNQWRRILAQKLLVVYKTECFLSLQTQAATKIQALHRSRKQALKFALQKHALIIVQNIWHKTLARQKFIKLKGTACFVQHRYRYCQHRKSRERVILASVVKLQGFMRRIIKRRLSSEKVRISRDQAVLVSNQVRTESSIASALFVEDLLRRHEPAIYGPCLRRLADRVNDTMNEANSEVLSVLPEFVSKDHPDIPLPPVNRKLEPSVPTPVRCNKTFSKFDSIERSREDDSPVTHQTQTDTMPKASRVTKTSDSVQVASKERIAFTKDDGNFNLAKQASELMREARAAMQKNKRNSSLHRKTSGLLHPSSMDRKISPVKEEDISPRSPKDENVGNDTRLENFGAEATMPSPIRSKEETPEWDWTSEW